MKKYKVGGTKLIEEVEVLRETMHFVVLPRERPDWRGKTEERESKHGYHQYFDTWEGAHEYLLVGARTAVENAARRLESKRDRLARIEALRP